MDGPKKPYTRRPKKHKPHQAHEEGWLISYADLMTLLFGFFVILYSMSKVDKHKYDEMGQAMAKQFQAKNAKPSPPPPPAPAAQFSKLLKEQLLKAGLGTHDVEITDDGKSVKISLRGRASFDSGKTILLSEGKAFVRDVSTYLKTSKLPFEIRVEGHTDDAAIYSPIFPTNWELSATRAAGVARQMVDFGIAPERVVASGYASSRPLAPNRGTDGVANPTNMALNRRVVIEITFPDELTASKAGPPPKSLSPTAAAPKPVAPVPASVAPARAAASVVK